MAPASSRSRARRRTRSPRSISSPRKCASNRSSTARSTGRRACTTSMRTTTPSSSRTTVSAAACRTNTCARTRPTRPGRCSVRSPTTSPTAFELRAGVRYTNDEKDFVTGAPEGFTFPDPTLPTTASLSDDNMSWDLAGTYSVNDAVNLYARVATGFRGASVQPAGPFGNQSVAEPETNTSIRSRREGRSVGPTRASCTSTCSTMK